MDRRLTLGGSPNQAPLQEQQFFPSRLLEKVKENPDLILIKDSFFQSKNLRDLVEECRDLTDVIVADVNTSQYIGILLPSSVLGVQTVLAVQFGNKIPVFLNYTSSFDSIEYAIKKCAIKTLLTSREFSEKFQVSISITKIYVEDFLCGSTKKENSKQPIEFVRNPFRITVSKPGESFAWKGETATIIFSSGSTGIPKGVMLSHHNLNSNCDSVTKLLQLHENDCILGTLPFFHSFGFMATLWLPLYYGVKTVYHSNPIDAVTIGERIQEHQCTILFSTPTFLQTYIRKCPVEHFRSLRLVITGAEKLHPATAEKFFSKFGILPIEGYGCTELSPVVSINLPESSEKLGLENGKSGSVGRPLPGISVKVVDPENRQSYSPGEEGLLLVQGPNVMKGYIGEVEKTREVLEQGWYNTGDMARVDSKGYIYITGRFSRFSKIGGEMVPHHGVEEAIQRVLNTTDTRVVVTGVSHPLKGEKLIILHLPIEQTPLDIVQKLRNSGIPNLWIPKINDFYQIESFPYLGSGKLDLKQIKELAEKVCH